MREQPRSASAGREHALGLRATNVASVFPRAFSATARSIRSSTDTSRVPTAQRKQPGSGSGTGSGTGGSQRVPSAKV